MKRLLLPMLALVACSVDEPTPMPFSFSVAVTNPSALEQVDALRVASVWRLPDETVEATSISLVAPGTTQLTLSLPSVVDEDDLEPRELLLIPSQSLRRVEVYRPRIVVYQDADRSERLSEADSILGIDDDPTSVAQILELEKTFETMSLEELERFYQLTDGRYTRFLMTVTAASSTTSLAGYAHLLPTQTPAIEIELERSTLPATELDCGWRRSNTLISSTSTGTLSLLVDDQPEIDQRAICGTLFGECRAVDLENETPPEITEISSDAFRRIVQCRHNNIYEVLNVVEQYIECDREECACINHSNVISYLIDPIASRPSWWPCGTELPFCDSTTPLYRIDFACIEPSEEK